MNKWHPWHLCQLLPVFISHPFSSSSQTLPGLQRKVCFKNFSLSKYSICAWISASVVLQLLGKAGEREVWGCNTPLSFSSGSKTPSVPQFLCLQNQHYVNTCSRCHCQLRMDPGPLGIPLRWPLYGDSQEVYSCVDILSRELQQTVFSVLAL